MKFVRKILRHVNYGYVNLPKPVLDCWGGDMAHVEMDFDEKNNTLTLTPR
jgi:hypothetical protein